MSLQLELLSHDRDRNGKAARRVYALRDEIEQLDRAVDALLRFMRPEQLKPASVPLNALLSEVANAVRKPEIWVECELDPSVLGITADWALLAEALRNIVANAVEAMPHGRCLRIGSQRMADGSVEIRVVDQVLQSRTPAEFSIRTTRPKKAAAGWDCHWLCVRSIFTTARSRLNRSRALEPRSGSVSRSQLITSRRCAVKSPERVIRRRTRCALTVSIRISVLAAWFDAAGFSNLNRRPLRQ
jgi:hypothetical protein